MGQWIDCWGTTPLERARAYPCEAFVCQRHQALYRGVTVNARPARVFRWLCQLRLAPYSYDWIDSLGRRSPPRLVEGCENLEIGQTVMTIFQLVAFEPDRHLTLVMRRGRWLFGDLAITYAVVPEGDASRLVAKLAVRYPGGALGWLMRRLLPLGDLVMMRKQLLTLKALAENPAL